MTPFVGEFTAILTTSYSIK